jgi:hypothetical protein
VNTSVFQKINGQNLSVDFLTSTAKFCCARSSGQNDHLITGIGPKQMHFQKGYTIKRMWTFCPHLLQTVKDSLREAVALDILSSAIKTELSP